MYLVEDDDQVLDPWQGPQTTVHDGDLRREGAKDVHSPCVTPYDQPATTSGATAPADTTSSNTAERRRSWIARTTHNQWRCGVSATRRGVFRMSREAG
jgi:hypothetical protein